MGVLFLFFSSHIYEGKSKSNAFFFCTGIRLKSMEDVVKLSTWMRWLSPLSWCLCVWSSIVMKKEDIGKINDLFGPMKEGLRGKHYACDREMKTAVAKRAVNRILQGRYTCSYLKVKHWYWEKRWQGWEVGMWSTEDQLHFDLLYMFLCR